ncbi:hypothetical protein IW139_003457 [Coemansia sp. RSA 353]|nr:hypothetical protein GGH17_002990 [Coemansia sp. RSA 788]KAJ2168697.1 hypothetical protein GGH15_001164 [Coemansia sp. RSA 562]KAJ2195225.1 hypothetical protein IW144_003565 [Coemansia sp. RSA 522]KAJ2204690.1 hypothetical protein IW145_003270 [Coemansia sp. RSA 521]KAJ2224152.1 hypothetical protein EV180_003756 [Coemansia sp. RSA 518]KAJ2250904.1 hypothetical protein GGH97_000353 [Coemansia sp. RSA 475]KAJ2296235.1 hypothetical protein IW139_003457 [Coemansia sp. RSA 353]KAJ2428137.1 hyp
MKIAVLSLALATTVMGEFSLFAPVSSSYDIQCQGECLGESGSQVVAPQSESPAFPDATSAKIHDFVEIEVVTPSDNHILVEGTPIIELINGYINNPRRRIEDMFEEAPQASNEQGLLKHLVSAFMNDDRPALMAGSETSYDALSVDTVVPEIDYDEQSVDTVVPEATYDALSVDTVVPEATYDALSVATAAPEADYDEQAVATVVPESTYVKQSVASELPETVYGSMSLATEAPETEFGAQLDALDNPGFDFNSWGDRVNNAAHRLITNVEGIIVHFLPTSAAVPETNADIRVEEFTATNYINADIEENVESASIAHWFDFM